MGQVWRATDTTLGRQVAIKILPDAFAANQERLARFEREAKTLASLNHPNIATIYGFEKSAGLHALVMELVDGDDLSQRIARGAIPIDEALPIARQIADALEAAHEHGVIHRDLKPANIKVRSDGTVKVLDFGLAKALDTTGAMLPGISQSPTFTTPAMTEAGMILGTAAYMSPEQAKGRPVDKRTDIWAFGCVLYEALTMQRAFGGATVAEVLAVILEREPDWSLLPAATPAGVRRLLRRCLAKEPKRRLHDIADARIEIDDALAGWQDEAHAAAVAPPPSPARSRLAIASALALTALVAAASGAWWARASLPLREVRMELTTPPTSDSSVAVSPDGRTVIFVGRTAGRSKLWLRTLDSATARPLAGTDRGTRPFWSPDGKSIGFFADVNLKRMDIDGGSVKTLLSSAVVALGGTWNAEGTILYGDNPGGPILRTSASGADPAPVTTIGLPEQRGHSFPEFLPDGRHFLYFVTGAPDSRGVYVGTLDSPETHRLFDAESHAVYAAATGHLLFVREGHLLAQRFDVDRLVVEGSPFPISDQVAGSTTVSASPAGAIAFRTPPEDRGQRQLAWVDRSGRETDKVVYPDNSVLGPALSPDGQRIAVYRFLNDNMDIWAYETRRRSWERITFDPGDDIFPLWARDGASVIFGGVRKGQGRLGMVDLYQTAVDGSQRGETLLLSTPDGKFPMDLSPDGRVLLYSMLVPNRGWDIWALPLQGERKPFEVAQTEFNEGLPQFSPDGKWIAYQSNKTGQYEVYLRPFPGPGADTRVSTEGGTQPSWNANSKEVFYIGADDRLMSVPVRFSPDHTSIEVGAPVGLFATRVGSTAFNVFRRQYLVGPDGQSFVLNSTLGDANASPISLILDWKPAGLTK